MPNSRGQPRRFSTEDDFTNAMKNYLEIEKVFPNIAGFCVYADISRETYYEHKVYYPYAYKRVEQMLEDAVLHIDPKYAARVIFYMKNKHGYKDIQEQNISVAEPIKINLSNLTDDELRTLKELQEKAKADDTK